MGIEALEALGLLRGNRNEKGEEYYGLSIIDFDLYICCLEIPTPGLFPLRVKSHKQTSLRRVAFHEERLRTVF